MANLWVIVTGLAVLVGRTSSSKIVLLRRVGEGTLVPPVTGEELDPHSPAFTLLPSAEKVEIDNRDLEFRPDGTGAPVINEKEPFIRVGEELEDALRVQRVFVGERAHVPNGWSRVFLSGGGGAQIWPLHVDEDLDLSTVSIEMKLKMVEARDLIAGTMKPKNKPRVANGMLYYRQIGEAPKAVLDGTEYPMTPIDDGGALPIQNGEEHYVAWVTNSAMMCDEDFDRDFFLLYDVLSEPVTQYVPVIRSIAAVDNRKCPPGQCMSSYALGPAEP